MRKIFYIINTIVWTMFASAYSNRTPPYTKNPRTINAFPHELSTELVPINPRDLRRTMSGMNECTQSPSWEEDDIRMTMRIASIREADRSIKFLASPLKSEVDKMRYITSRCEKVITVDILAGGLMDDWNFGDDAPLLPQI